MYTPKTSHFARAVTRIDTFDLKEAMSAKETSIYHKETYTYINTTEPYASAHVCYVCIARGAAPSAVCCNVLQCVAVCCNVMQCVAVYCSKDEHYVCILHRGASVAVCCSVLQCVAECCSVLQ